MAFHQQVRVESADEIHELVRFTRISQFSPGVLINRNHEAFSVPARIQVHLVRYVGFAGKCHVRYVVSGMCSLKTTEQFPERKRLCRRFCTKQSSVESMVDVSLVDQQAASQSQDQQKRTREKTRPEMKSQHDVSK